MRRSVVRREHQVRLRDRLAELLRAGRRRSRGDRGGPQPRDVPDRGALPTVWFAPRPRVPRRPAADRAPLLHELSRPRPGAAHGLSAPGRRADRRDEAALWREIRATRQIFRAFRPDCAIFLPCGANFAPPQGWPRRDGPAPPAPGRGEGRVRRRGGRAGWSVEGFEGPAEEVGLLELVERRRPSRWRPGLGAGGVAQAEVLTQQGVEAAVDEPPGAHVLRLLLHP